MRDQDRCAQDHMLSRAKALRRRSTIPEHLLWRHLRRRRLAGLKFRRQHVIGPYVVDFYCASSCLIVEVDGESHDVRAARDARRRRYLERAGYRVMRVHSDDVLANLSGVLQAIALAAGVVPSDPSGRLLLD